MNHEEIKKNLLELYRDQDQHLRNKFNRSLPLQDALMDRFERARTLGFSEGSSIYNSAFVFGNIKVGVKSWIGPYVILDGSAGAIEIGDYCSISAGVHIYTHDSVLWALSGGKESFGNGNVYIGSNTYIGAQSIIKAGTHIGNFCVIGANSFVNSNVEDNSIIAGSSGKKIGQVFLSDDKFKLEYF